MNSLALERIKNKVSMLMEDEEIVLLFDMARKDLANQVLLTQPKETEKREELYNQARGLTLLERQLVAISNESFEEN